MYEELKNIAIRKTISILAEIGIKFRKTDFTTRNDGSIMISATMSGNIHIYINFDSANRSKLLTSNIGKFYNYFNCSVDNNTVTFFYTKKELDIEQASDISSLDESTDKQSQIIQKVQKLLALSSSDNEHEAISASLKAQRLLAKYSLSMDDVVEQRSSDFSDDEIVESQIDVGSGDSWKYQLAVTVAKNYRCKCYTLGSATIVFRSCGRNDCTIARSVFFYLFKVCKRLATNYAKEYRSLHGEAQGVIMSFSHGFISGVADALQSQRLELMIVESKALKDDWASFIDGVKERKFRSYDFQPNAYSEGVTEGKRALNNTYVTDNSRYIDTK